MGFGLVFLRKLSAKNTNKLNVLMVEPIMQIFLRIEIYSWNYFLNVWESLMDMNESYAIKYDKTIYYLINKNIKNVI